MPSLPPSPSEPLTLGEALRHGLQEALSDVPAALLIWSARCVDALVRLTVFGLFAAGVITGHVSVLLPGLPGLLLLGAVGSLARVLVLGGAVRRGSQRMCRLPPEPLATSALGASGRSLSFWWLDLGLETVVFLFQALALGATATAFVASLQHHGPAGWTSLGLALAVVLALAVSFAASTVAPVAFVRAVLRDEAVATAVWESGAWLWRRPWKTLAVLGLTSVGTLVMTVAASTPDLGGSSLLASGNARVLLVGMVLSAAFSAFVQALAELTRLHALSALELSRMGVLAGSVAPTAQVGGVPMAELILEPPEPVPDHRVLH